MRMKRLIYLSLAALMVLAVSCKKDNKPDNDNPVKYGVDGVTPMPDAVDIGLVVDGQKVLWANFNLGASKESGKESHCRSFRMRRICSEGAAISHILTEGGGFPPR